jgi:hypothetical protein
MTKEDLLAQAHREAQSRSVPVVQVLVEWLVPRMVLLPTDEDVEKLAKFQERRREIERAFERLDREGQVSPHGVEIQFVPRRASQEQRKVRIGKLGREKLNEIAGRELTEDEIQRIEETAESELVKR